jgi:hypothetical protein
VGTEIMCPQECEATDKPWVPGPGFWVPEPWYLGADGRCRGGQRLLKMLLLSSLLAEKAL